MGYPSDEEFEAAREHRTPPSKRDPPKPQVGQCVRLPSGGPLMTVVDVDDDGVMVEVAFHEGDGGRLNRHRIRTAALYAVPTMVVQVDPNSKAAGELEALIKATSRTK